MEFLGIGFAELVLIMLLALLVVGPEKLPRIARTMGRVSRQIRQVSNEFTTELKKEAESLEAAGRESAQSVKETIAAVSRETSDTVKDVLPKAADFKLEEHEQPKDAPAAGSQSVQGPAKGA